MTYLLVMFIFWTDPALGPIEHRYQYRIAGYYNTAERCEERRKAHSAPTPYRLVLYSECRKADDSSRNSSEQK